MLFTFPSRYWFTIGRRVVFSLGRWSSRIPTGFHVPRGTQVSPRPFGPFAYRTLTSCGGPFQTASARSAGGFVGDPTTPATFRQRVWALSRSLAATEEIVVSLRRRFLSFPAGTKMFQFPAFPLSALCVQAGVPAHYDRWVPPFGHPRINACLQLPEAFRCWPRPSSAPGAKASTIRPL